MSAEQDVLGGVRLAAHPRATAQVRRAKGAGALLAFVVAALLTHRAGSPPANALAYGLAAGVCGYMVAWKAAVTAWRALMVAEMRQARAAAIARAEELAREAAEREAAEEAERRRLAEEGGEPPTRGRRRR